MEKVKWACPKCGSDANNHSDTYSAFCKGGHCMGFLCECEEGEYESESHGKTYADPCKNAVCYHCGWNGKFPKLPKGLVPWEKNALNLGWTMPEFRVKELAAINENKK